MEQTSMRNTDNVKVIPVENFMHNLFRTTSVSYDNKNVEFDQNYPYKAYIETLLNHGSRGEEDTPFLNVGDGLKILWFGVDGKKSDANDTSKSGCG